MLIVGEVAIVALVGALAVGVVRSPQSRSGTREAEPRLNAAIAAAFTRSSARIRVTMTSNRIETSGNNTPGGLPRAASYDDVRAFLRLLNRRKWHLAGVTALVCALAGLVLAQLTPEYRATALVMLDTRKARVTNTPDVVGGLTLDIPAMQTEIEVLRSGSLLGRVADKLRLDQDPEYGARPISTLGLAMREVRSIYERWIGVDVDKGRPQHDRDLQLDARGLAGFDAQAIDNSRRARAIE